MTNYERLTNMSIKELAIEFCAFVWNCGCCPGCELCEPDDGAANGMIKWLEQDAKEETL